MANIPTKFLIISDTHAEIGLKSRLACLPRVDVAIHCGDLTEESKIGEFHTALDMLRGIRADLKLVICGNHDFSMDLPLFLGKIGEVMERDGDGDGDGNGDGDGSGMGSAAIGTATASLAVNDDDDDDDGEGQVGDNNNNDDDDNDDDNESVRDEHINGNSDTGMDSAAITPDLVRREYGYEGEPLDLFTRARNENILFLREGIHDFVLDNGACLRVFASPFTPSSSSSFDEGTSNRGAFQYDRAKGHLFDMNRGHDIDVVITHGPPLGILDRNIEDKIRVGCGDLFGAVEGARPRMHCFGHVHEGWGGKVVTWREKTCLGLSFDGGDENGNGRNEKKASHFEDIDHDKSFLVESLSTLRPGKWDDLGLVEEKKMKLEGYLREGYCGARFSSVVVTPEHGAADQVEDGDGVVGDMMDIDTLGNDVVNDTANGEHGNGRTFRLEKGKQTLFVNAAIQGLREEDGLQLPWIVEIDLSEAPPFDDMEY